MQGDTIIIEDHHRRAAARIAPFLLPKIRAAKKFTLTVAGESGSGKSETAQAIADELARLDSSISSVIFQQDDYFVFPPKSNDRARREDLDWVGPQEVNLPLLDRHLAVFRRGQATLVKPLVSYDSDSISTEQIRMADARVAIAEGTYTTLLDNADCHIFIARNYEDTRAHREKRKRSAAELDPFIDSVLKIEHDIISAGKERADIIISRDYDVEGLD
ncbi:MAG TPA: hypothetical protein ENK41_02390 [Rhodobacteraceae bacterium]|nr:hypothetical protein [Paracoccaceae bacterium]